MGRQIRGTDRIFWYVLMARTGREQEAKAEIQSHWDTEHILPFLPVKEIYFRKAGTVQKENRLLFPGYVFVETTVESHDFLVMALQFIKRTNTFFRVLEYGDSKEIAVREEEKVFWQKILNQNYCVECSRGVIEGDRVRVKEGPFIGSESRIKKIDRHKRQAVMELELMGAPRSISVSFEVLEKIAD
ncbi:MAG: antiterminator LoaP [Clostridium sp.]|jgi:transcriptional antiterminator NusG|nr:antiterminator LoaP [Clostridium sp.]